MDNRVAEIAKGLTKAQQEALSWFKPCSIIGPHRPGYRDIERLGLVERDEVDRHFAFATPLGQQVRQYLMENSDHE